MRFHCHRQTVKIKKIERKRIKKIDTAVSLPPVQNQRIRQKVMERVLKYDGCGRANAGIGRQRVSD